VLAVWVVAAGGALLLANALDSPADEGARDEAQAVAPGPVAIPRPDSAAAPPALALILDQPPPMGIGELPPREQAARLVELARADPDPRRLVELGSALQLLGRPDQAAIAFRGALERDPDDVAARTGLAMARSGDGPAGLARASAELRRLAREYPDSQLVAFNQGVVEIYRRRGVAAARAWSRAVELGPATLLGSQAAQFVEELRSQGVVP
jgi:Flp pilus assembly protein TadD